MLRIPGLKGTVETSPWNCIAAGRQEMVYLILSYPVHASSPCDSTLRLQQDPFHLHFHFHLPPRQTKRRAAISKKNMTTPSPPPPPQSLLTSATIPPGAALSPLEQEVLDEYSRLLQNMNQVSSPSPVFFFPPLIINKASVCSCRVRFQKWRARLRRRYWTL